LKSFLPYAEQFIKITTVRNANRREWLFAFGVLLYIDGDAERLPRCCRVCGYASVNPAWAAFAVCASVYRQNPVRPVHSDLHNAIGSGLIMIRREASCLIKAMAKSHRLLIIAGPRYAGKSVLAKRLLPNHTYIDLESPGAVWFARNRPVEFLERFRGDIVIDGFHRAPELFKHIKGAAAKRRIVLITSRKPSQRIPRCAPQNAPQPAPPQCETANTAANTASEVAADAMTDADIGIITLLPPSIKELNASNVSLERDEYIHRGFIPDAYRKRADPREAQLNCLTALLQQDIAPLVRVENREAFKRFFRLLAERVGLALNLRTFAETVGVPRSVLLRWIKVLEAHFVIFSVPVCPSRFHIRTEAKAIKAPKFYFTDVGLAAYLLKIETPEQVHRHPAVGNLFENLVVAEALKAACNQGQDANMSYYRNRDGFEVDLILSKGCSIVPIEIKSSPKFNASFANNIRRFHTFGENITDGYVVYSGAGSDRVKDAKYVNFREVGEIVSG
jgi:uncharacterized protein